MIRNLVDSGLRFPILVLALVAGLFTVGYVQLKEMPVDTLPDFAPVYVEVQTESLGLSAVEVEQLITAPMEQLLLNGVPWLEDISSESIAGLSSIVIVFEPGTDPLEARQVVQERLSQGRDLPRVAKAPVMLQPLSSTSRVMMVRVDSTDLTPIEQSVLARWTIKPALMGVPGVANVAIWGQREQQMQVQVDPARLADMGVSLSQVVTTSANSLWVSPLSFVEASTPGTGGFIDTPNQRLGIQHILPISDPEDLASVTLEGANGRQVMVDGEPVLLGDVVTVVEDHQPLIGDAVAGDNQGLMLVIEKFPEANALEVTQGVERTLTQLAPGLAGVEFNTTVFRPAGYIDLALSNTGWALLLGLLLLLVALALLYEWRVAAIVAVALPLSLVTATLVLYLRGTTMNLMLLAGLVLAAAAVLDDAVVNYDNVKRRLRDDKVEPDRRTVVVAAVEQMRRPTVFATLVMLAATVPAFFLGYRAGLDSAFFGPVVLSYALALLASMAVTVFVVPVMSAFLLRGRLLQRRDPVVTERLAAGYGNVLTRALARPMAVLTAFGVVAVAGFALVPFLDADMKPHVQERTLLIHWQAAPGTSHPEMSRITSRVAAELRGLPGVENVGAHVGRALTSDEVSSVNSGELWVALTTEADHDETMADVEEVVSGYPGMDQEVLTYTDERQTDHSVGSTPPDDLVVRVYGQEYDVLQQKAEEVRDALAGLDGVGSVAATVPPREPQIEVQVDLAAAQQFGLTPGEVRRAAAILVSGIEVGSLFEQQKVFEVVVLGTPAVRHDLSVVNDLLIESPNGDHVRLGDVAEVAMTSVPTVVRHNAVSRYVDVTANVSGADVGDLTEAAEEALQGVAFPLEYHAEILGDHAAERSARTQLFGFAIAALVGMFLLFQAYLRSWMLAAVAFLGLPLALSGGVISAVVVGSAMDIGSLLGMLVLVGVYSRAVLALFGRYYDLADHDGGRPNLTVVTRGAKERFLPVLVVAVGVAGMLLPSALLGNVPGLEVLFPLAVVTLGGLVTTTAMSLLVLPLVYLRLAPSQETSELDMPDRPPARPTAVVG